MDVIVAETKPSKPLRLNSLHKILIEYQFRLWMIQNKRRQLTSSEVQKVLTNIIVEYELPASIIPSCTVLHILLLSST